MANRIDLQVGVVDETKAGNDQVIAGAAIVQKTLDQRHQEMLETQRQRELEYAKQNADALLNADHAEHAQRLAEYADFRARLQRESDKWLEKQTQPLTQQQLEAADAARALLANQQPAPVVQKVVNDIQPIDQPALQPVVQRVVADQAPVIQSQQPAPVVQRVAVDQAPVVTPNVQPVAQKVVVEQPAIAKIDSPPPVVQKVAVDQAPIAAPAVKPVTQAVEVDAATLKQAEQLTARVTKSTELLHEAMRSLANDPSAGFSESELAMLKRIETQLRSDQIAALNFADSLRNAADVDIAAEPLRKVADAIQRDVRSGTTAVELLQKKIVEIDGIKATASIKAEGVEKTLQEFRNVSDAAATAAQRSRELWDSADKSEQLASDTRKAALAIRESGDASAKAQADYARLIAEANKADQAAAQFRHLAGESEELARVALRSANSFEQLTREEGQAGQEAQQLADQNKRVSTSLDTAAFARHREELARTAAQYREVAESSRKAEQAQKQASQASGGLKQIDSSARNSGQGMLQLAYAADDLQYGLRGIVNNIPGLLMSLGATAKTAGQLSIVGVGVAILSKMLGAAAKDADKTGHSFDDLSVRAAMLGKAIADTPIVKGISDKLRRVVDTFAEAFDEIEKRATAFTLNPFVAMNLGSKEALKQLNDQAKEYVKHERHLEAMKLGAVALADSKQKEAEAWLKASQSELKDLDALENRYLAIKALIASGGLGSKKILGELYDPKDDKKNVENLTKLLNETVFPALIALRKTTVDEFTAFMTSHSEKLAARKREIDLIVEQATQTKALQLLESERQVVAIGDETAIRIDRELSLAKVMRDRLAVEKELAEFEGSDNKPDDAAQKRIVELVRQRGQLEAEALRLSEQAIDPAIRLRNINEEILKGLASRIEETKHAEERERGWIEDQKRIRNVTAEEIKKAEETIQALKAKRVEFEKRQESELARQKADAAKQEQAWIKLVEDTRKQADAERMKREDAMQRAAEDRITKLQNMLKGEKPQEQLKRIDEGITEQDVQKKALQERQKQARDKFIEEAQGRGLVDQNGKAIGDTPEERRRNQGRLNAEQRRINQDVARGFRKDLAGGKADEELANVRADLLGGIVDGGFVQGKVNKETADALKRIIDEVRQQKVEAARQAAIVAGLKQLGKGAEVPKPLEKQPLPPKVEGELGGERLVKRNEQPVQKPIERIVPKPVPIEVPELIPAEQPESIDTQNRINKITDEIEQLDRDLTDALQRANVAKNVPQRKAANITVDRLSAEIDALRKKLQEVAAEKRQQNEQRQVVKQPAEVPPQREKPRPLFADEPLPQPAFADEPVPPVLQGAGGADVIVAPVEIDDADARRELSDLTQPRDVVITARVEREDITGQLVTDTVAVDQQQRTGLAGQQVTDVIAVNQQNRKPLTGQQVTDSVSVDQQRREGISAQNVTDSVSVNQQQRADLVSQNVTDNVSVVQQDRRTTEPQNVTDTITVDQQQRQDISGQNVTDNVSIDQQDRKPLTGQLVTDTIAVEQQQRANLVGQNVTDSVSVDQQDRKPPTGQLVTDTIAVDQQQRADLVGQQVTDQIVTERIDAKPQPAFADEPVPPVLQGAGGSDVLPMSVNVDSTNAKRELSTLTEPREVVLHVRVERQDIAAQNVTDSVSVDQQQRQDISAQSVTDSVSVQQQQRRELMPEAVVDQVAVNQQQRTPLVGQEVVDRVRVEQEQSESRQESRQNVAIPQQPANEQPVPPLPQSPQPQQNNQSAASLKAVAQAMQQLGAAQQKNDSTVLDAINQLTALVTEQAKRQVQTTDVVAQVVSHVNQLASQFTANDNAARLRAMSAGGV